jgi:hypothetical protein
MNSPQSSSPDMKNRSSSSTNIRAPRRAVAGASKIKYNYAGSSDSDGIDDGSDFSASSKDIEENSDDEYELY